ncbi:sigma-70 family RNA polymerase sigma factor [Streptomyces sp. NPDC051214]|uniref:RNA polymerase sigma factor n=1 Tax=Streptomyces sp. NPDC051214 TaxID=3155282 RepID=UPI003427C3D6
MDFFRATKPVERPRAWLRTVALRAFLRQAVNHRERPQQDLVDEQSAALVDWHTPLEAAELTEQQREVFSALVQLPFKQRCALAWQLDGFTTEEIADAMGTTQAAVLQNLSRGRRALKDQLGITRREEAV